MPYLLDQYVDNEIQDERLKENVRVYMDDLERIERELLVGRQNGTLTMDMAERARNEYASTLDMMVDDLPEGTLLKRHYSLQMDALRNGWSVADMPVISAIFLAHDSLAKMEDQPEVEAAAEEVIEDIRTKPIKTMEERSIMIAEMANVSNGLERARHMVSADNLQLAIEDSMKRPVHMTEYPEDDSLKQDAFKQGEYNKDIAGVGHNAPLAERLRDEALRHQARPEDEKQALRERSDYVIQRRSEESLNTYVRNRGQETANIRVSNREAMRRVFGEDALDLSDSIRMSKNREDRTVTIHHAKGNERLREKKNVLEIDLSGSGMYTREIDYHGQNGKLKKKDTPEWENLLNSVLGTKYKITGYENRENVRRKNQDLLIDGKTYKKTRYCIPGPTPDHAGLLNAGNYRIGATTGMSRQVAEDFLKDVFDDWIAHPDTDPMEVHVNLTGYSRGAVSAGESLKAIKKWISEHPQYRQFADKVRYDVLLYDPVPGPDGKLVGYGSNDLRDKSGQPENEETRRQRENITVFQSLAVDHNIGFTPEVVRGAGKYVFTTGDHRISQGITDQSQMVERDDGKAHKAGFYDMESGEYFRGSGLAELNKGLYIADEDQNLMRITSLTQLNTFFKEVKSKEGNLTNGGWRQSSRRDVLRTAAKNYFIDNVLERSYESEHERNMMLADQADREQRFQQFRPNKKEKAWGLEAAKDKFNWMKSQEPGSPEYKAAREDFVKGLKSCMEKMEINGSRSERKKLCEICDLMIGYEREMWYEKHGLTPSPAKQNMSEELNETLIKKQEERFKQLSDIKARLAQDKKHVQEELKRMEEAQKWNGDSKHYTRMKHAAEEIMRLNDHSTLKQIRKAYDELDKASENYIGKRSPGVFGKRKIGTERLNIAENLRLTANSGKTTLESIGGNIHESHTSLVDMERKLTVRLAEGLDRKKEFAAKRKAEGHKLMGLRDLMKQENPGAQNEVHRRKSVPNLQSSKNKIM